MLNKIRTLLLTWLLGDIYEFSKGLWFRGMRPLVEKWFNEITDSAFDERYQARLLHYGELHFLPGDSFKFLGKDGIWTIQLKRNSHDECHQAFISNGKYVESLNFTTCVGGFSIPHAALVKVMGPPMEWLPAKNAH